MPYRLALAALLLPGLARAHAILVASDPPAGGSVPAGNVTLELRYNSRIDQGRSRVSLTRPRAQGGAQGGVQGTDEQRLALLPAQKPDMLRAGAALSPGDYVLHWFVLATDGHITRGTVPFTATATATGASAQAEPAGNQATR